MCDQADRLIKIREEKFSTARQAVEEMQKAGRNISYKQYLSLERGRWPKSRHIAIEVSDFFSTTPEYLLFGLECPLAGLSDEGIAFLYKMVDELKTLSPKLPPPK